MRADEISAFEAARILKYHVNHVYRLLRQGKLTGRKVLGRVWLIPAGEVERLKAMQDERGYLPRRDRG